MEVSLESGRSAAATTFMAACAADLVSGGLQRLPVPSFFEACTLDYTRDSLRKVDDYVLNFRERLPKIETGQIDIASGAFPLRNEKLLAAFVYMLGGYTGEVIRRVVKRDLRWIAIDDLKRIKPELEDVVGADRPLAMSFSLIDGNRLSLLPLDKVRELLVEPRGERLHSFSGVLEEEVAAC